MKTYSRNFWIINWLLLFSWISFWLISTTEKAVSQTSDSGTNLNLNSIIKYLALESTNSTLLLIYIATWLGISVGLTWWIRKTALQSKNRDKTAIWYSYQRFFQWLINGIWLGWFAIIWAGGLEQWLNIQYSMQPIAYKAIIDLCYYFIPPAIVITISYAFSQAVFANVRGMEWTKKELIGQAIFAQIATFLPIMAVVVSLSLMLAGKWRLGITYLFFAYVSYLVFSVLSAKSQNFTPHALTTGELRDRIFSLAEKAGVKLQQIYILPTGKGKLANAFAHINNNLLLSEYLLEKLNKRELDSIIAHELGHLKHQHPQRLTNIRFWTTLITGFLVGYLVVFLHAIPMWSTYVLAFFSITYSNHFFSRRFEYAADAEAVALSGDPEACIRALKKITHLNLLPTEWNKVDGQLVTHPSLLKRAQAIAKLGQISSSRLKKLLENTDTKVLFDSTRVKENEDDFVSFPSQISSQTNTEYYRLPSEVLNPETAFSTDFKNQIILKLSLINITIKILIPTAIAISIQFLKIEALKPYIYIAGLLLTILIYLAANNRIAVWGHHQVKVKLKAKLEQDGILVDKLRGIFVGFAPDNQPHIYEGFSDWDMGFVFLKNDSLYYFGEQTSFALDTNQVKTINLGRGFPTWHKFPRVYISWWDQEKNVDGSFNLAPAEVDSLQELVTEIRPFKRQLQAWWELSTEFFKQSPDNVKLPEKFKHLTVPSTLVVTGKSPQEVLKNSNLSQQFILNTVLAIVVTLPFSLPLTSVFYIILVACLTTVFSIIPLWLYRDKLQGNYTG